MTELYDGDRNALQAQIGNQALILAQHDRRAEASRAVDEVLALAERGGYGPLATQIRRIKQRR